LQCLEKEPLRRYSSAQALADDLERHAAGRPIAAQPPSETERLARLAARDGYEILGEIGRGPRSTVYRAVHGPLRQSVALKVFEAGLCTRDQWGAWLRRGAAESTGLEHPCLVPILQTGWWSGRAYVATEHAPQGSLDARLLDARLKGEFFPLRPALELVERLTEIVGYVHRQGAVHGNLKPSNVLLAADGIPRLADFRLTGGLFVARNAADQPSPPGRGQSEGSGVSQNASADAAALAYLAPELLADPAAEPRLNADIYGLGLILYELLAGRPAFQATTASDMLELVGRGCPPPSSLNPQAPAALDAVCAKCLRRDPWRRYARAFDVGKRLRGILEVGPGRGGIP
jgi:serine/threonine protein kinase